VTLGGTEVSYAMERSYSATVDAPVFIEVPDTTYAGILRWKRLGSAGAWNEVPMVYVAQTIRAEMPRQVPLTKLEYSVEIIKDSTASAMIPETGSIPIRFKGDVPMWVLIPHVLAMFLSMLFSTRAGLEAFAKERAFKKLISWTLGTLFVGGFVFGPLMSYYAFDLFWTGWPQGQDVTDNKTLIALIGWMIAAVSMRKPAQTRWWVLCASLVMFAIFMIPHSI
jgi:uncharacterized membrane protein